MPELKFKPSDKVFLNASDISTTQPLQKFAHQSLGPYPVFHLVGTHAYSQAPPFDVMHPPGLPCSQAPTSPNRSDPRSTSEVEEVIDM